MKQEYRWRKMGCSYRELVRIEGYVVLRAKGCVPFVVSENDLKKNYYDTRKDNEKA